MVKSKKKLLLLILCFITYSCNTNHRKSFTLSVEYFSPWTYPTKYTLSQNAITVHGVSKKGDPRIMLAYVRLLNQKESDSIYMFLKSLYYDTLQKRYNNEHFFDGTTTVISISGENLKSKKTIVYMRSTKITDTLEKLAQGQVLVRKYKWDTYLEDEKK